MKWEEFPTGNWYQFSTSSEIDPPAYKRGIFRTQLMNQEAVVYHHYFIIHFPEGAVKNEELVTINLDAFPGDLTSWGNYTQQDIETTQEMWHKTQIDDFAFDTYLQLPQFFPGDFSTQEIIAMFQRLQQKYLDWAVEQLDVLMKKRQKNDIKAVVIFREEFSRKSETLRQLFYAFQNYLQYFIHYLIWENFVDDDYEVPEGLSSEELILKHLNVTLPRYQRDMIYDEIIEREDFRKKLTPDSLKRAQDLLKHIEKVFEINDVLWISFGDMDRLYRSALRDKIVIQATEKGEEVDITNATEQTLVFSPQLYDENRHYIGNVKVGKRVLVNNVKIGDDQFEIYYVKGDKRLKHEVMDRTDHRLERYGNTLIIKPETLQELAYDARKIKTLSFVNPDAVLTRLKSRGITIEDLIDLPTEIRKDYKRGHVLYNLAIQRLTGLEAPILEGLLKQYGL